MKIRSWVLVCVLALAGAPALAVDSAGASEPAKVGVLEPVSIATAHPYPTEAAEGPWERVIQYPGATYIRVHFSAFDLAPGDWLEISSPSGASQTYTDGGIHGTGEFWAFSVLGDTAVLRLHAVAGGAFGLAVDSFGRGIHPLIAIEPGQTESVCGTQDWRDVECYNPSTEYDRAKGATLLLIGCCTACSGFKASDSGQFMTNNHCISSQSGVQSTEVRFNYKLSGCGSGTSSYSGAVTGSGLQKTDGILDYTLFTTVGDSSSIPCLSIDNRLAPAGERMYIAGHPLGDIKKLSIDSDQDTGGKCKVDASPCAGNDATSDICYLCDTTNGSSGSPVFGNDNNVIAIHHFGGCYNSGVRMDRIYPQISGLLTGCGPGSCGNGLCDNGETQCTCASDCGAPPASESACSDGLDNDCDGKTDCADADCGCCKAAGQTCTANSDCCSNKCTGRAGRKTCK